jgi:hypothetical protein
MEDPKVKIVLTLELHMMNQLLNDKCIKEECGIHISKIGVSGASVKSTDVFTQSLDVWAQLTYLLA